MSTNTNTKAAKSAKFKPGDRVRLVKYAIEGEGEVLRRVFSRDCYAVKVRGRTHEVAAGNLEKLTAEEPKNTNTGAAEVAANKSAINRIFANGEPYAVIVRRYWDLVATSKLYSVRVKSVDWLKGATGEHERRFFKARVARTYTESGYLPYRWSCRQWGTNRLNIQLYEIVKAEEAAKVEQFERKDV